VINDDKEAVSVKMKGDDQMTRKTRGKESHVLSRWGLGEEKYRKSG